MREHLLELLNREPFTPFKIVLTSGEAVEVSNANLVAMGETLMHVFSPKSDRYKTLRISQITSTDMFEPAA